MRRAGLLTLVAVAALCAAGVAQAARPGIIAPGRILGLQAEARLYIEANGIVHIDAHNDHDLYLLAGFVQANDRLFQMDVNRRLASGTLAELLGPGALQSDVTLRTIGLRRAAERSWAALLPETQAALAAYAEGVNAWLAMKRLPPEYGALELTHFEPWTPVDSVVIAKLIAFGLSFDLDIQPTIKYMSWVQAGQALGFDGSKLFFDDLERSAPFDTVSTVPDASVSPLAPTKNAPRGGPNMAPDVLDLGRAYLEQVRDIPLFRGILDRNRRDGSNEWAVSGALTDTGFPMMANDPHLQLGTPSTFYPLGLEAHGMAVFGSTFPGAPFVIQGYNKAISWGTTNNAVDVTDTFQEQVVPDPDSPSGLSTMYLGAKEPIIPIPEVFRANQPADGVLDDVITIPAGGSIPAATLIVPRRDNGPIIQLDLATGAALSVQYAGFSATRELDCFRLLATAGGLDQFTGALQYFDFGSQNFVYADRDGNIAYFTTGEMPVREDLQAGTVTGTPPWFIRNGTGGNEWLPVLNPQPQQALPHEILPFSEMPHVVNPPAGFFVNSNNDPAGITLDNDPLNQLRPGGGLFYLAYRWDAGFRAERITDRIRAELAGDGKLSFADMESIQADVKLRDAQVFVPYLLQAFDDAGQPGVDPMLAALAADEGVVAAIARFRGWNFDTPTGIPEGYDGYDEGGLPSSVAATIYSVWRGRFVADTIDAKLVPFGLPVPDTESTLAALRNLLDNFSVHQGVGASGVNFFDVAGVSSAADRRDIVLLRSLREALDRLASSEFGAAFGESTNQDDYAWGKLHRIVFAHVLDGPFSVPPAGGMFPDPLPGLPGIPTDGGFQTVDAASHDIRATGANGFMFGAGPVRRFVGEVPPGGPESQCIWPGGTSGVLGSPFSLTFLPDWLHNLYIPSYLGHQELGKNAKWIVQLVPSAPRSRNNVDRPLPVGAGTRARGRDR